MIDQSFVDKLSSRMADLETQFSDTTVTSNQQKFRELAKEYNRLKRLLEKAVNLIRLRKDTEEHRELVSMDDAEPEFKLLAQQELDELEKKLPNVERELMIELLPENPDDSRGTIIEIRAGTGGLEAAIFAGDLSRMYMRYAELRGWKSEFIDGSPSEMGGYKEIVFSVQGEDVYRILQYEGGIHRVQRIPATEASGRIHTSAATVAMLPEADDTDEIEIKPDDLRVDVYRSSGAGGQHVNKTDSAVRITHLPTGIVAACQDERSQHKNRAKAMRVLRSRLLELRRQQAEDQIGDSRRSQVGSGDRSERIRTYNFPQNRVTDHRINLTLYSLDKIIEGELDPLLKALSDHDLAARLEQNITLDELLDD